MIKWLFVYQQLKTSNIANAFESSDAYPLPDHVSHPFEYIPVFT